MNLRIESLDGRTLSRTTVRNKRHSGPDEIIECIGGVMPPFHSVKKACGFSIGDRVRLNRRGLECIHGLSTPEMVEAQVKGVLIKELYPDSSDPADLCMCMVDLEAPLDLFVSAGDIEHLPKRGET